MSYVHQNLQLQSLNLPFGKAVCVGRNYADHAKELNNQIPSKPVLFIKPASCAVSFMPNFKIVQNRGNVHYEAEIAILIGQNLSGKISKNSAQNAILGLGSALDLTLRDEQSSLKKQGLPWELAKSFDNALVLTPFVTELDFFDVNNLAIKFFINNQIKQNGNCLQMLWQILDLIVFIAEHFNLQKGDLILTGTPAGVGILNLGDNLKLELSNFSQNIKLAEFESVVN